MYGAGSLAPPLPFWWWCPSYASLGQGRGGNYAYQWYIHAHSKWYIYGCLGMRGDMHRIDITYLQYMHATIHVYMHAYAHEDIRLNIHPYMHGHLPNLDRSCHAGGCQSEDRYRMYPHHHFDIPTLA